MYSNLCLCPRLCCHALAAFPATTYCMAFWKPSSAKGGQAMSGLFWKPWRSLHEGNSEHPLQL